LAAEHLRRDPLSAVALQFWRDRLRKAPSMVIPAKIEIFNNHACHQQPKISVA
jgi:hypothetical protein